MNPFFSKEAAELRDMWQSRVLTSSEGVQRAIITRMFIHAYKDAVKTLFRATFPGFRDLTLPQIVGLARVEPSGRVTADVWEKTGRRCFKILYDSQDAMRADFGRLADKIKLNDFDRIELFQMLQGFVVADMRVDPYGKRLAS